MLRPRPGAYVLMYGGGDHQTEESPELQTQSVCLQRDLPQSSDLRPLNSVTPARPLCDPSIRAWLWILWIPVRVHVCESAHIGVHACESARIGVHVCESARIGVHACESARIGVHV